MRDTYGAGDSFAAGLTYALGLGLEPQLAVEFAATRGAAAGDLGSEKMAMPRSGAGRRQCEPASAWGDAATTPAARAIPAIHDDFIMTSPAASRE